MLTTGSTGGEKGKEKAETVETETAWDKSGAESGDRVQLSAGCTGSREMEKMERIWQNLWKRKKKKYASQDVEMEESENKENAGASNAAIVTDTKEESVDVSPQKVIVKTAGKCRLGRLKVRYLHYYVGVT